jgi:hypothetical protein
MDVGPHSWEPTIGVCPKTGAVFFYPVSPLAVAVSTDQGASWKALVPDVAGQRTHLGTNDPYLYVDPATCRVFVDDLLRTRGVGTPNCSMLSWTDDAGATWTNAPSGCWEFDHQTIFAGPPVSSATIGYPNIVYRCAINTVTLSVASTTTTCGKSVDGGLVFTPTGEPAFVTDPALALQGSCDMGSGHGVVDARGFVYLPKGNCGVAMLSISSDEGATWARVKVSDLGMPSTLDGGLGGVRVGPVDGYCTVYEHEAGVGVDGAGNVYYFWMAKDRLPYLTVSRDGGHTWDKPRMIGAPGLKEATMPALAVGGNGSLAVAYVGSMNSPGGPYPEAHCGPGGPPTIPDYANTTWNGYMALTANALDPDLVFWTATINDPADPLVRGVCEPVRCAPIGDFIDVRLGPDGTPWAAFVDGCKAACPKGENDWDEGIVGRLVGGPALLP